MRTDHLTTRLLVAGLTQASILTASALVPTTLRWREELAPLPRLHRQMHWVYGGYVYTWWKTAGYWALTVAFAGLTAIYTIGSVRPPR